MKSQRRRRFVVPWERLLSPETQIDVFNVSESAAGEESQLKNRPSFFIMLQKAVVFFSVCLEMRFFAAGARFLQEIISK